MRLKQLYYQVFYKVKNKCYLKEYKLKAPVTYRILWRTPLKYQDSWQEKNSFLFLNIGKTFETIDWNYSEHGKLWTYNLTYFDFLNQNQISKENGVRLIKDFIVKKECLRDAMEPYPLSLRGVNWVKFLSEHKIKDAAINASLFNDYQRLRDNLEYHLLGNHLLENGFSLLFGAVYFNNENWYRMGKQIIDQELKEQLLPDGAHFELSPMYHQIILYRVLDSIQLLVLNNRRKDDLLAYLKNSATAMLGWLQTVSYKNGNIPMFNDAAFGIAPTTKELFEYGKYLGLQWDSGVLKESGYRKWETDHYECFMDVGAIGPNYIPGHAHADTFNFELYIKDDPFIVDTGTSTYEKNERRQEERGTKAHNTVLVNNANQTEVWGGFRVARRAKIIILEEKVDGYSASHNGYKRLGVIHKRSFRFAKDEIAIIDTLVGKAVKSIAYFHFHPSATDINVFANSIESQELKTILNFNGENIKVEKAFYNFAEGFNRIKEDILIQVSFTNKLTTTISFRRP